MTDRLQYHLRLRPSDVGRYVILPGDPGRVPFIASFLDDAQPVASNREFVTFTGSLEGARVSVTSTGIGGPSAAIAIEELIRCGADTFIRAGTAGAVSDHVTVGDLVNVTAAIRDDGTSAAYAPLPFPATAHPEVSAAIRGAARELGYPCSEGIVRSGDAFYAEMEPEITHQLETWRRAGVAGIEMEAAAIFVVGSIRRVRAGAVVMIVNRSGETIDPEHVEPNRLRPLVGTAVEAVRILVRNDLASKKTTVGEPRLGGRKQARGETGS